MGRPAEEEEYIIYYNTYNIPLQGFFFIIYNTEKRHCYRVWTVWRKLYNHEHSVWPYRKYLKVNRSQF